MTTKRWKILLCSWKNQYCQNGYSTKSNLQTQCNLYQISDDFFFSELQQQQQKYNLYGNKKTPNSKKKKKNLEKEKLSKRNQVPWLQTVLHSYSNQNSMVLAQKQTKKAQEYISMEQDKNSRSKPT